jgi:hypothetical protein
MNEDVLLQLRTLDPVKDIEVSVPPPLTPAPGRSPSRFPRATRLKLLAVAGLAAVIIAATAILPGLDSGGSIAVAVLRTQAALAADTEPIPAEGFRYERITGVALGTIVASETFSVWQPTTTETWVAADGSGRVRTKSEPIEWPGPRDRQRWKEAGSPELGKPVQSSDERFGPGEFDGRSSESKLPPVQSLPADAEELETIFREEAARSSASVPADVKLFEYTASVLLNPGASPEQRSALYELAASLDGVGLERGVSDPIGRTGTAVYIESDYSGALERDTLIFDEQTAQPLAHTESLLQPEDFIDNTLLSYQVIEDSGDVASVTDRK